MKEVHHKRTNAVSFLLYEVSREVKNAETESGWWLSGAGRERRVGVAFNRHRALVGEDEVLEMNDCDVC